MRRVITAQDLPEGGEFRVPVGTLVTPSARDAAAERGIRITEVAEDQVPRSALEKRIAIGADHGGFRLKERLKPVLEELGLEIQDVGVYEEKPADYPDIARAVAELVASGKAARGVVIDGAGIGSAMAANKVPGIRAALCYDKASARNSREHNDSNVLTLGGRLLTETQAEEVLRTWVATPFAGGRHQARVQKIIDMERGGSATAPAAKKGEGLNLPAEVCPGCVQRCAQTCAKNTKEIIASGADRVSASERLTKIDPAIAAVIDHTILKADATRADVLKVCKEARQYGFASVCVNPYWVPLVRTELSGTAVKVCSVVGFPLGATSTESKVAETAAAVRAGAQEIDMVINVGALRSGDHEAVKSDIAQVARAAHAGGAILKTILETALLDDSQKATACTLAKMAGADFVKTSTGFGPSGATAHDVSLMRAVVGPEMGVKASGGIRTLEDVRAMTAAGATRIGASASVKIVEATAS